MNASFFPFFITIVESIKESQYPNPLVEVCDVVVKGGIYFGSS